MENEEIIKLGYDEKNHYSDSEFIQKNGLSITRVIEVNKNSYMVSDGIHEMIAELTGKLLFDNEEITDLPTVGDWVAVQTLDNYSLAIIHSVLPRKTLLKRKESGKRIEFQLIAANIDFGLVVQSADKISYNLLDRYFAMLTESKIQPIAVFNKIDLLSSSELEAIRSEVVKLRHRYFFMSTITDAGVDQLKQNLMPGKTYCLLGLSGVGKTSILNNLLCDTMLKVNDVREKDGRGKHTTVKRQLMCLDSGSLFIDTPGIRELGNFKIKNGIDQTFDDILSYAKQCCYRDCTHIQEAGCAVREAVKSGSIEETRYNNFLKLMRESEFYEMSYYEKRKKDKSFGKMINNYKKNKRKK